MIKLDNFVSLVREAIPRFQDYPPNQDQEECIIHSPEIPLMIVAGPGSGKTTVLVLRALRLVFVNDFRPEQILITTFTKKAAKEIRSRLIEWGSSIIDYLQNTSSDPTPAFQKWLGSIDVNQFITGTLDSICKEVLTTVRLPSDPTPVLVEEFVSNALFMRHGLFSTQAHRNEKLDEYLSEFTFDGTTPNFKEKLKICRTITDRFVHDRVDLRSYQQPHEHNEARQALVRAFKSYRTHMVENNQLDYARLEERFYTQLAEGRFDERFTSKPRKLKALLVDEYQDTNPLQESIYFVLVNRFGASFTIVGDDDQSLYRFRGATVELFRDFVLRFKCSVHNSQNPDIKYLIENYRSTPEIVTFFNDFITNDPDFIPARVVQSKPDEDNSSRKKHKNIQPKPPIMAQSPSNGIPVLGMFRKDAPTLAKSLVSFLIDVFRRNGHQIEVNGQQQTIIKNNEGGDFGDSVFLSHTVNETNKERLPFLLRERFEEEEIGVFNPRGRPLRDILAVQQLLGIILECIDPEGKRQNELYRLYRHGQEAQTHMDRWRKVAQRFAETDPTPKNQSIGLRHFIQEWQSRKAQPSNEWPNEWPLLELCFKIITWIRQLHDHPEGQVYIEAVTRCISEASNFSSYRSTIVFDELQHEERSVKNAITDIFVPIAEDSIDIAEEILPHVPRSLFPFMTIHQAKGLEYPLVIVDVASTYTRNHPTQRFQRFPEKASREQKLEDHLAAHCEIGNLRMIRPALDRTFDDLVRRYYVAYSRPRSVLLLVGLGVSIGYKTRIKNIATGWRRTDNDYEDWLWTSPISGKKPVLANNIPFHLI